MIDRLREAGENARIETVLNGANEDAENKDTIKELEQQKKEMAAAPKPLILKRVVKTEVGEMTTYHKYEFIDGKLTLVGSLPEKGMYCFYEKSLQITYLNKKTEKRRDVYFGLQEKYEKIEKGKICVSFEDMETDYSSIYAKYFNEGEVVKYGKRSDKIREKKVKK